MKIVKLFLAAASAMFFTWLSLAIAQTGDAEFCKRPNASQITIELQNGKRMNFSLSRDGSKMSGAAASDLGGALVMGEFAGPHVFWEVSWPDNSKIFLRGSFQNGEGSGIANHSDDHAARIKWTARTAQNCVRWSAQENPTAKAVPQVPAPAVNLTTKNVQTYVRPAPANACPPGLVRIADGRCVRSGEAQGPAALIPLPWFGQGGISIDLYRAPRR